MESYRNPAARWLGSPNFTANRAGHDMSPPSWVVLHTMVGTLASANARFQQPGQQASAHYGVGLDGSLVQWVDERDAAWTNGNSGVAGAVGRNEDSITIEHEDGGDYDGPRTPELYARSAALVRDVCLRNGVPIDRQHVIGHRECTGNQPTACPDALDVDRIVREAARGAAARGGAGMALASESSDREPFWEVRIRAGDRHLMLAWWSGGMGQRDGYTGTLTDLGRPPGAGLPVLAELTLTTHLAGHLRVNVSCTTDDGATWGLVYGDETNAPNAIVQPWQPMGVPSNCPAVWVPAAGATAFVPHSHITDLGRTL